MQFRYLSSALIVVTLGMMQSTGCNSSSSAGAGVEGLSQNFCERLTSLECVDLAWDECMETVREELEWIDEVGCFNETRAHDACLANTPDRTCQGDDLVFNDNCDAQWQAVDNCQRKAPDYCEFVWGDDSCTLCLCETCPCDEACVAALGPYFDCVEECQGVSDCMLECVAREGAEAAAGWSECDSEAYAAGECSDTCLGS